MNLMAIKKNIFLFKSNVFFSSTYSNYFQNIGKMKRFPVINIKFDNVILE